MAMVGLRIVTTSLLPPSPSSAYLRRLPNTHRTSILASEFRLLSDKKITRNPQPIEAVFMANSATTVKQQTPLIIDSHLHVWAAPQEAANKYPYFPGQEPALPGNVDLLLQCMDEAGVDGALIVQPINHKFDHSYVSSVVKRYPTKFIGCCLANPASDGSGIKELERLVLEDGYRAVRFNPYLWPSDENMTNEIGRSMFSRAGELGVPVGFMCMKGLNLHLSEIEQLCTEYPSTTVLLDHLAFCKPPMNDEDRCALAGLLKLSKFPQVYVKLSALFRVSRTPSPYLDLSDIVSHIVANFGAQRVVWGSDFPFVLSECGYGGAKEAVHKIADQISLSESDREWIMGKTIAHLFQAPWQETKPLVG